MGELPVEPAAHAAVADDQVVAAEVAVQHAGPRGGGRCSVTQRRPYSTLGGGRSQASDTAVDRELPGSLGGEEGRGKNHRTAVGWAARPRVAGWCESCIRGLDQIQSSGLFVYDSDASLPTLDS